MLDLLLLLGRLVARVEHARIQLLLLLLGAGHFLKTFSSETRRVLFLSSSNLLVVGLVVGRPPVHPALQLHDVRLGGLHHLVVGQVGVLLAVLLLEEKRAKGS